MLPNCVLIANNVVLIKINNRGGTVFYITDGLPLVVYFFEHNKYKTKHADLFCKFQKKY